MNPENSSSLNVEDVISAIQSVIGKDVTSLHEPAFDGNEITYLKNCIDTTFVSSVGPYVDRFERDLATFTGAKFAVAVVNGTAALHIALKLAGVEPGDEVLIPALTFVATANAVSYCGAIPHFVDSEESTLGINVLKLREYLKLQTSQHSGRCTNNITGRVIRAIVPMHTFGHPSDMQGLLSIAHDFNLALVEDAAESLGSLRAKHLTTTAKLPHPWKFQHDEIGYNFRMPNINAALGCAQLEQLPSKLNSKRKLFGLYQNAFVKVNGAQIMSEPKNCRSNYWLQTLLLSESESHKLEDLLIKTNENGIATRPVWEIMNKLPHFKNSPRMDLTSVESLSKRIINIPSSPNLVSNHL
jgi:perosamine synthetase